MTEVRDILTPEVIAALNAPIERARGLPAAAYTSEQFFAHEQARLFPASWMGVAFGSDIADVGDAMPVEVCGLPIILVRNTEGTVVAFHNVCRHRATLVLTQPEKGLRQLQCPYHAWTYSLDGKLVATPFWDGTAASRRCPVDPAHNSLVPLPCKLWNQVVYVNLSGDAEPFDDYVAPFEQHHGHVDLAALRVVHRRSWEFKANWKLVMDNWEVYHHVWVHEGVFDKMSDEVDLETGQPYTDSIASGNVMMLRVDPQRTPRDTTMGTPMPTLPTHRDRAIAISANALLPNTTLTIGPIMFAPAIYLPVATGVTRAEMAWYVAPEAAEDPQFAAARAAMLDRWLGKSRDYSDRGGLRSQDHTCMEWQQLARGSPVADDVKFSPTWEADVLYFQRWLVARLTGASLPEPGPGGGGKS